MKKMLMLTALFALMTVKPGFASGDHEHGGHSQGKNKTAKKPDHSGMNHKMAAGKEQMLQGRLIGLTCLLQHNSQGEKHQNCAKMCAEQGLPLGLMTDDHKIYHIMGEGHATPVQTNKKLLNYVEMKVMVKASVHASHGVNAIIIRSIKKM